MSIKQYDVWIADLNPRIGSEAGKRRPVVILQTNLLNKISHPSTIICPISSNVLTGSNILRVHIKEGVANMNQDCDIMIDQIRAIDNNRLIKKVGSLTVEIIEIIKENIEIVMDLED